MNRYLFLLVVVFVFSLNVYSQQPGDTIQITKNKFYLHGQRLNPKQLLTTVQSNNEAFKIMKKAKSNYDISNVIGFVGGFMVGWPLGTAIAGGDANWALAGLGAGIIIITIPIVSSANKKAKEAINIYNTNLRSISHNRYFNIHIETTQNGVGMILRF